MKRRAVKAVASAALSLALATSFMAGTVRADAQEVAARDIWGKHHFDFKEETQYEEANSEYHFVNRITIGRCTDKNCNVEIRDSVQIGYEQHNLRGATQPPARFYCLDCGYEE